MRVLKMKAKLEYTLPEETEEFMLAVEGGNWKNVIWDLDMVWLRNLEKYEDKETVTIEEIRDKIRELLDAHGLTMD